MFYVNVLFVCLPVACYTPEIYRISVVLLRCPDVYKIYSMVKLLFIFLLPHLIMKFPFALLLSVLDLVTECIKTCIPFWPMQVCRIVLLLKQPWIWLLIFTVYKIYIILRKWYILLEMYFGIWRFVFWFFFFFLLWRCDPTRVMASSFLRFSRSHTTTHHSR